MRLSLTLVCLTALEKCPEQKLGFEVVARWYSERLAMQLNLYSSQCTQSLQECIWLSAFHHNKLLQRKILNPLTTDDESTRHTTLAACCQLAQSVLKIGFCASKMVG